MLAGPRRLNPPLSARSWIVVPFGNVTRSADLEWLRDASVNLLSLDLSRWTDISVVDDKRVGDLVRELPAAKANAPLTLSDGLGLARRAGAGILVMGDFYKLGAGARIAANVFDVKSGNRLRSITQQAVNQDSLLTAFGPLARGVLALPPPSGVLLGAAGTTRVDAYQEYLQGSTALNHFDLTEAVQHLSRALAIDSTFALAHYKLSLAFAWSDDPNAAEERAHALWAARLGQALPPRERALIAGRVAAASNDDVRACAQLRPLVGRDSLDVEAMYGLAECEFHAVLGAPEIIDSVTARYRGNWNSSIALFRRVLRLDPTYHPAFSHVLDALSKGQVVWCPTFSISCANDATSWTAIVIRDADSLLMQPAPSGANLQIARAEANRSRYLNLRAAQEIAQEWVGAGPGEARAQLQLAELDLILGDVGKAELALQQIGPRSDPLTRRTALVDRATIAIVTGNGAAGRAVLDTLRRETADGAMLRRVLGALPAAFGKLRATATALDELAAAAKLSPERARYLYRFPLVLLGQPAPGLNEAEHLYWATLTTDSVCAAGLSRCRTTALLPTMAYAARAPRSWWPPYQTPEVGFRFGPSRALALRDTVALRASVHELDSIARVRLRSVTDDQATTVIASDAALALGDSAVAMRLTRQFVDSVMPAITRLTANVTYLQHWSLLLAPRMMLQRADLAAALGSRDEARTWYTHVLDLWSEADPELQPTVARIRAALVSLGAPPR